MNVIIQNGTVYTPDQKVDGLAILISGGKISALIPTNELIPEKTDYVIDAAGMWVVPGMIDIHVHGSDGVDTMDSTRAAYSQMSRFFAKHGVTAFLPTTVSASKQDTLDAIHCVQSVMGVEDGAQILGIHLEGPFLNKKFRGAQPEQHLREVDPDEYSEWIRSGVVRMVTIAPEYPGMKSFILEGLRKGIHFAVGHSGASFEEVAAAVDLGLRHATHTFNGMLGFNHREPGVVGCVLTDDRVFSQIIVDGNHVHPAAIRLLLKAKGIERTVLITDAMRAAGMPDGEYLLGGDEKVIVQGGIARTKTGSLAGSTLTMDNAIRNYVHFTGLPFERALPSATRVPATAIGIEKQKGSIAVGMDADIVLLDSDMNVRLTLVAGRVVYNPMI